MNMKKDKLKCQISKLSRRLKINVIQVRILK